MNTFKKIADQKEHLGYREGDIFQHTVDKNSAIKLVKGCMKIFKIFNIKLPVDNHCVDLGCGAGYITKEFNNHGFNMIGLEKSEDALKILKKHNPDLNIVEGDMSHWHEPESYDFIFSREVYLITRVNAFTDQSKVIQNIIDSLKSGGVFVLIGSDTSFPHCMDYDLIIKYFRNNNKVEFVSKKLYEIIFYKFHNYILNYFVYKIVHIMLKPLIYYKKKKHNWASQYIIVFKKK